MCTSVPHTHTKTAIQQEKNEGTYPSTSIFKPVVLLDSWTASLSVWVLSPAPGTECVILECSSPSMTFFSIPVDANKLHKIHIKKKQPKNYFPYRAKIDNQLGILLYLKVDSWSRAMFVTAARFSI